MAKADHPNTLLGLLLVLLVAGVGTWGFSYTPWWFWLLAAPIVAGVIGLLGLTLKGLSAVWERLR